MKRSTFWSLEKTLSKAVKKQDDAPVKPFQLEGFDNTVKTPYVLLPYQQAFVTNNARVRISRKSRRIGMSWAVAGDCALDAARENGRNVFYIAYDKNGTETFINDAAHWARAYNLFASEIEEVVLKDEDEDVIAYRIRFASGYSITALSSRPRNIRSKEGRFVFDEFAFHDDPEGLLKAGIAVLMWGKSQIDIISSVNGVSSFFEELCDVIAPERGYYVQQTTLDDALADGLYKRICLVNNREWTLEGEIAWRAQLFKEYGPDAKEELLCVPASNSDPLFNAEAIERYATAQYKSPQKDHYYLAGLDPNMGGSDEWYLTIWDLSQHPIQLVAEYHEANMLPGYCRKKSLEILDRFNIVLMGIEKNNGGLSQAEDFQVERPRLRIELVNTTHISKIINTDRIANALTDGDVRYPKESPLYSQMKKFSKKLREGVRSKDDAVCSWMVAFAHLELALSLKPKKHYVAGTVNSANDRLNW